MLPAVAGGLLPATGTVLITLGIRLATERP
jgi:hypothetical protein